MSSVVSVVIPTFNRIALLREALDSVAAQTFREFDVVVVDDGSSDDVAGQIAGHAAQPRIIRQARGGPAAARNRGVAESRGRWIAFLDSDDLWLPQKLERFVAAAQRRPDLCLWYGPMTPVDEGHRPVPGRTKPCHGGRITRELFESSFVHVPTVMIDRSAFRAFSGFDESLRVCEDYDLWLRMSARHEFGLIEEPLALRRLHDDRLSKSSMRENLAVKIKVLERFYQTHAGNGLLDEADARTRLADVALAAARAAWRAGHFAAARNLLDKARGYGAAWPRTLWMQTTAVVLSGFDRAGEPRAPSIYRNA